jgi:outer membrane protein insertion porin family
MNSLVVLARKVLLALLLAVAVPGFSGAISLFGAAPASAAVASSISVKGNQRIEVETIQAYLTIKKGKSYSAADIDDSIKALYNTGLFADVSIVQRGSVLAVTVVENPIINSVTFEGNKKIKTNVLEQIVEAKTRGVLTDARLQSDVARIKEYYARSGRSGAVVASNLTQLPNNRVDVSFIIREGDRTGVGSILFVGNQAFSSSRLAGIITTRKTNWLSWLNKRDIYSDEKLQADQEALRKFYLSHGYADFQVLSADASFDDARGRYVVTFTVDEGPKYTFGDITIDSSISGVDPKSLQRVVKTQKGKTFNATDIEKTTEELSIELSRQGYVFAQVRPRGDRDYTNNIIALTYTIDEGARTYIERIDIRGNSKTRDYVIRREFDVSEGDAYNRVLVDRAQRRLRDLGFFKTVDISTEPGSAPDKVVVVVNVVDQSTGSISAAVGVQTNSSSGVGLIGEVALEETNFLGRGQAVRISVGAGQDSQSFNLSFTDPYFLGSRVSGGFDAYGTIDKSTTDRPFDSRTYGGDIRVGLPLNDNLNVQLNYKLFMVDTSNGAGCVIPTSVTGCYFPNGTRWTSSLGYVATWSTIDNKLDPHEGTYLRITQDFAGAGGDAKYVKTVGDARLYYPVLDSDTVAMLKVTGGNITGLGGPVAIPDNFFKGGETIRGFASLGYGPRDTTPGAKTGAGMAIGGKNFIAGTAEVSFPLPFLPPDFGLKGAVFADAGMLFGVDNPGNGVSIVDDKTIRSSVGASIIWASPFGLIRADVAQAITHTTYDKLQMFRIGAGAAF